jgi:hypothetical protein
LSVVGMVVLDVHSVICRKSFECLFHFNCFLSKLVLS